MKLKNSLYKPMFSHIYAESKLIGSQEFNRITGNFPEAVIIPITHYKDVFNKPGQHPGVQQNSKKLILAENRGRKIYPGAPYCHNFGHDSFFYVSQILNCPFDCSYCYLKGKFPSSNIVVFINTEDYLNEIDQIKDSSNPFVTLSYDSDIAALEPILGLMDEWYSYMSKHPNITFELRTKSLFNPTCTPMDNFIIAVSLLPQQVISLYENGTPDLYLRISMINRLIESNYRVRLAIEPILDIENAEEIYENFIEEIRNSIDLSQITDVSTGCFRMPVDYYKNMCRGLYGHFINYYPFETIEKQVRYSKIREQELLDLVIKPLSLLMDKSKIYAR
ncbi:MAG: hypothetical protein KAH14_00720 [Clostridiales bacterium]|nr:hypothetical protein [Clostridiales bacterium]